MERVPVKRTMPAMTCRPDSTSISAEYPGEVQYHKFAVLQKEISKLGEE
jgi:hypothetical protein